MNRLTTRTVTMTNEQWRHLEAVMEERAEKDRADVDALLLDREFWAAEGPRKDAECATAILTSIRSAGA